MATYDTSETEVKLSKAVDALRSELLTLDALVTSLESHVEIDLPHDNQSMITEEVCCCYDQRALYEQEKSKIMYSSDYILERQEIVNVIKPDEEKVFKRFGDVVGNVETHVLDEASKKKVVNFVATHPILSRRLKLELLHQPE